MSRPSEAGWRVEVLARYGNACLLCGSSAWVQADHLMPKSQGGPRLDVRNGIPLCVVCHEDKTNSRVKIPPDLLLPDTREFLAESGWCVWQDDGSPAGRGWKHFESMGGYR